jgi:two-component system invasion response regulator UvrY
MLKFLIVDDHHIFRQGVIKIIADSFPGAEFGEAENSADAFTLAIREIWDIAILDINLPGRSGLDLIKDMQRSANDIPILVLSIYEEDQLALRALKAGAKGYLAKGKAGNNLVDAINRILAGLQFITDNVAELLAKEYKKEGKADSLNQLSDREYFTMLRLASGESVTQISKTLSLSVKTISTYRTRVFRKLNIKNHTQLIEFVKAHVRT